MFKCKVCAEKDARIQDLKDTIIKLEKLLIPVQTFPNSNYEVNNLLSGTAEQTIDSVSDTKSLDPAILEERLKLLSGDYF